MQISRLIVCIGGMFFDPEIGSESLHHMLLRLDIKLWILENMSVFLVKEPFSRMEYLRTWAGYSAISAMDAVIIERIVVCNI